MGSGSSQGYNGTNMIYINDYSREAYILLIKYCTTMADSSDYIALEKLTLTNNLMYMFSKKIIERILIYGD